MSNPNTLEDQFAAFLATTAVGLVILALIVAIWFLVKCFELVVRVLLQHPDCQPLLISLVAFLMMLVILVVTGGQHQLVNIMTGVSFLALIMVAKIVEIYYDELFQPALDRQTLIDQTLHEPWWNAA